MQSGDITAMVIMVTAILTTGGVLILRPLAKKLGVYLEVATQQRLNSAEPVDVAGVRELLTSIDARLSLLEERQEFAEALISAGDTRLLSVQAAQYAQERN